MEIALHNAGLDDHEMLLALIGCPVAVRAALAGSTTTAGSVLWVIATFGCEPGGVLACCPDGERQAGPARGAAG